MSELTPALAAEVVAACQANAAEMAAALSRALGGEFEVVIGEAAAYDAQQPPAGFGGPGLAVVLELGTAAAVLLLPESTGLLPDWYVKPDTTGQSTLDTVAQELSALVLPESLAAERFRASGVDGLAASLARGEPASDAQLLPLMIKSGEREGQMSLVWPLSKPGEILPASDAAQTDQARSVEPDGLDVSQLPPYERSLFKISVPVTVTLATQRKPIHEIVELGPGSIVKFDKTCDQLLELLVGSRPLAQGEVVKVGDKFGLRISNMVRPKERFVPLHKAE